MRGIEIIAISVVALVVLTGPAHAYLDPGTGSIILQSLIAGIAGALLFFKSYWWRFLGLFRKSGGRRDEKDRAGHPGREP